MFRFVFLYCAEGGRREHPLGVPMHRQIMKPAVFYVAAVLVVGIVGASQAGDHDDLRVIGFSKDGRWLAFESFGIADGSGFPYSTLQMVDVDRNVMIGHPVEETGKEGEMLDVVQRRAQKRAAPELQKRGIKSGNSGELLYSDPALSSERLETLSSPDDLKKIPLEVPLKDFLLTLQEHATDASKECTDRDAPSVQSFDLIWTDTASGARRILQHDTHVPSSRGCPLTYRIRQVHRYGHRLAVFIVYLTPGFEGPNVRNLVVTTALPP
jgi:predicted secreted protein